MNIEGAPRVTDFHGHLMPSRRAGEPVPSARTSARRELSGPPARTTGPATTVPRSTTRVRPVLAIVLLALASTALAQVQWYEHYQHGLELEQQQSWEEAAREFEAATRVESRPRKHVATYGRNFIFDYDPHYHLARCLIELERYPAAAVHLRTSSRAGVTDRKRLDPLRDRLEAALRDARPGARAPSREASSYLVVTVEPQDATVFLDGSPLGNGPLGPEPVRAGPHTVRLEAPGFAPDERRITVEPGTTYNLTASLQPRPATPGPSPTRTPAPVPPATVSAPTSHQPSARPREVPAQVARAEVAVPPTVSPTIPPPPTATAVVAGTQPPASPSSLPLVVGLAIILAAIVATWLLLRRRRPGRPVEQTRSLDLVPTLVQSGSTMGDYTLIGVLGRGGMATTYSAQRGADGAPVAVKVPHEGCLADPSYVERFVREGRLGEQLHHPRIVRIFEAGEEGGRPFLAMELLEGSTLKVVLRTEGPLGFRRSLEIATDIAEALDYAHVKGVIHRDLKPENVMILPDGTLKVMDFGIARLAGQEGLTSSQFFLGTPLYAAPEMMDPKSIDHRVDLYSLGIIFFEMLQGTVPFSADSPFKVLQMHQREPLPSYSGLHRPVPESIWRIVTRLCAKQPEARFASAEALLVELHVLLRDKSLREKPGV